MVKTKSIKSQGEAIRAFILNEVSEHPRDISRHTAEKFGITRQAIHKHLLRLIDEGALVADGSTRQRVYSLRQLTQWHKSYEIAAKPAEDVVWRKDIEPLLGELPDNVLRIWHYVFTEMFNNALDHSEGSRILVEVERTAADARIMIIDDGIGIFRKIQQRLNLLDERHAVLELAKGKLTTDPARHSGEGIFFSSRMVDQFQILSGGTYFSHSLEHEDQDWVDETTRTQGTTVLMRLNNHTSRTPKKVFDKFTSGDNYGFTKTIVPVRLAQYGNDFLVSRSQARRVLERVDRFRTVLFDFEGVEEIGQAFADEIFRVFAKQHPQMELVAIKTRERVRQMIDRAIAADG